MERRIVVALLLALVGVWLFVPTSRSQPAFACTPTEPMPNYTPPPPTTTPVVAPTATFTTGQAIRATSLRSAIVVVGVIREINVSHVVLEVEGYRRTSFLPATITITTYRERVEREQVECSPNWEWVSHRERYPVLPLAVQDSRAVFFLDSYSDGAGEVVVGRASTILLIDGDQLRDIDTGASLGPADQLDTLMVMESRPDDHPETAQSPPAVQPSRWQPWMLIPAGLALLGLALLTLGLILKRHSKT
jgi:hypothetical protein